MESVCDTFKPQSMLALIFCFQLSYYFLPQIITEMHLNLVKMTTPFICSSSFHQLIIIS